MKARKAFERDERQCSPDPSVGFRRLAQAVIIQAMREAEGLRDMQAVSFLEDEGLEGGWSSVAGVEGVQLFDFEVAGCPRVPNLKDRPARRRSPNAFETDRGT